MRTRHFPAGYPAIVKRVERLGMALICAAIVLVASVLSSNAQARQPASDEVRAAMRVRVLQSELMVAALTCREQARYNTFVRKYEPKLVRSSRVLKTHFETTYGRQGTSRLNAFVTYLANTASTLSIRSGADYCPAARTLFDRLLDPGSQGLDHFALVRTRMWMERDRSPELLQMVEGAQ